MAFLDNLNWRFATKSFDTKREVTKDDLDKILSAIQYTPTSRGLQPYHIYIIKNTELKNRLKPIANDQAQIDSASYVLIFCSIVGRQALLDRVSKYVDIAAQLQKQDRAELINLEAVSQNTINKKTDNELKAWAIRQTYIAFGFAIAACAELKIDSCPMEGFNRIKMNTTLSLPDSQKSQAILTIGYRESDPKRPKIRFPEDDLFTYL
ncbi:NAD(P)H-dependent oxidoreductase [Patescibacteria group bacterium]|nr:NAD(P)H-dependent oxidoreductase [Patescibacteria group bacterium]